MSFHLIHNYVLDALESLESFLVNKRKNAMAYRDFFADKAYNFFEEPPYSKSNYWLNTIILKDKKQRDLFLNETNSKGISTRPIWTLMSNLSIFKNAQCGELTNADWLEQRVVNIPSSPLSS